MKTDYDIAIIGAGIVGLATAYQISKKDKDKRIVIVEKESSAGQHQSGHNSGVIHSGIYYRPGSLKAINCKKGYDLLLEFCDKHNIEYDLCGKVIVAINKEEIPTLLEIFKRGESNGLKGIKILNHEETLKLEPNISCVKSIYVPQTGIIDYLDVVQKLEEILIEANVKFLYNTKVTGLKSNTDFEKVYHSHANFTSKKVVCCAGLYADKLGALTFDQLDVKIVPFRGEYYSLKKEKQHMIKNLIYPVPNPAFPFLGVHYTRKKKGGIEAGPNAVLAFKREGYSRWDINLLELLESLSYPGFLKLARKYWRVGIGEMLRSFSSNAFAKALIPLVENIERVDLKRSVTGVRAQALKRDGTLIDDYYIKRKNNTLHVINAPSPAATSCLAIGEHIVSLLNNKYV